MGLLKYGSGVFVTLSLMFGAVSLPPAKAQDNRFLKISDLSGFHTEYVITPGIAQDIKIDVSFTITNISGGGLSLVLTPKQARDFRISHGLPRTCRKVSFGSLPRINYNPRGGIQDANLRRFSTHIPEGDSMIVTINMECDWAKPLGSFSLNKGVVSGRVTVIKGRRILTRPISGRF